MNNRGTFISFVCKSILITGCIGFLFYSFYPRYDFKSPTQRFDKISGKVEYYNGYSWK